MCYCNDTLKINPGGMTRLVMSSATHVMSVQGLRHMDPWNQVRTIDDNLVWFTLHSLGNAAIVGYAFRVQDVDG
jgi:hypothetical protein